MYGHFSSRFDIFPSHSMLSFCFDFIVFVTLSHLFGLISVIILSLLLHFLSFNRYHFIFPLRILSFTFIWFSFFEHFPPPCFLHPELEHFHSSLSSSSSNVLQCILLIHIFILLYTFSSLLLDSLPPHFIIRVTRRR